MIKWLVMIALLLTAEAARAEIVEVSARMEAGSLAVGETSAVVLEYKLVDGYSLSEDSMPKPIVQVDVPASIVLAGKVLTDHKELAKNDLLHAPYEFAMGEATHRIAFQVKETPNPEDRIGVNFIAYLRRGDGEADGGVKDEFVRLRIEVPIVAGALGTPADAANSRWGEHQFLNIGDQAEDFELPQADGTKIKLSDLLGKQNVLLTTYRAYW